MTCCPKCKTHSQDWQPYRVGGLVHLYWSCCGVRWHAKADLAIFKIQPSWLQVEQAGKCDAVGEAVGVKGNRGPKPPVLLVGVG